MKCSITFYQVRTGIGRDKKEYLSGSIRFQLVCVGFRRSVSVFVGPCRFSSVFVGFSVLSSVFRFCPSVFRFCPSVFRFCTTRLFCHAAPVLPTEMEKFFFYLSQASPVCRGVQSTKSTKIHSGPTIAHSRQM